MVGFVNSSAVGDVVGTIVTCVVLGCNMVVVMFSLLSETFLHPQKQVPIKITAAVVKINFFKANSPLLYYFGVFYPRYCYFITYKNQDY